MTRIGHYDNPYLVAEWHRGPPGGTWCEPLILETADRAVAHGWLYARGGERTAVLVMHPRANFSHHYVVPGLVEAGCAVLCVNSRWLNNDTTLLHEVVLLDVAAAMAALRDRYDRIVLLGNSGGGSLLTFYVQQAHAPGGDRLTDTAAGDPFDLNRFELPPADALVYLAAHTGEGHYLLHAIDASVTDETDPLSCDPALDPYDPANGFVEPPGATRYEPEFLDRYRAAQRARVERLDAVARERVERRRSARERWSTTRATADRRASIVAEFLTVYRTDADPRAVDLSLDPSARTYGSLWGVRPDWINYGAVGFGRVVSPEAWLSTWSGLSSRASIEHTGKGMTLPALVVAYSGDQGIFPSDTDLIASSLGAPTVDRAEVDADHYGFPPEKGRDAAVRIVAEWVGST
ncbi:MAG: alpha/beta hydrolase family protein [Acidimicrobiia bacterium]